ncbi:uncharacterized protein LOC117187103 [Drosophila miranda]|uniref:uncharacterized protein LOC117187102 n=1 Tax=Drosophila miranda TaxID=7229 RepID=UPI00143FB07B|nr:uncharacterized protein LOC117187102 [Drosophila miranda]XP_033244923.1 uncharacterized protein LOC117187103 [Drosophila miranda]
MWLRRFNYAPRSVVAEVRLRSKKCGCGGSITLQEVWLRRFNNAPRSVVAEVQLRSKKCGCGGSITLQEVWLRRFNNAPRSVVAEVKAQFERNLRRIEMLDAAAESGGPIVALA